LGVVCIKKYDIAAALICKLIRSWMSEHRGCLGGRFLQLLTMPVKASVV